MTWLTIILILAILNVIAWFVREWYFRQEIKNARRDAEHHRVTIINQGTYIDELHNRIGRMHLALAAANRRNLHRTVVETGYRLDRAAADAGYEVWLN